MCIIIHRPAENSLSLEMLQACAEKNKDGWGIMLATETGIVSYKGMLFGHFKEVYESLPKNVDMGIHFRIKTHGLINLDNCHPFKVLSKEEDGEDLFLMHNGMINSVKMHKKEMSDTWHWSEILLRPIVKVSPKLIHVPAFQWFMESSIGWSRMLLLDEGGNFVFLKEEDWKVNKENKDGCRYSVEPPSLKKVEPATYGGTKNNYTSYGQGNYYRQGAGYGERHKAMYEYDEDGVLITSYGRDVQGGGTNGSSRFPEKGENVIALRGPSQDGGKTNVDTPANNPGTIIGNSDSKAEDRGAGVQDVAAAQIGATLVDDQLAQELATAEGMPEKGGEADNAGLMRFPEGVNREPSVKTLTKEEWETVLSEVGLEELSEFELESAHNAERYSFGIIPNTEKPLGVEFDNCRTHMLLTEKGAEDELPTIDPEDFEGKSFANIHLFVKEDPEEAALFLYRNYG